METLWITAGFRGKRDPGKNTGNLWVLKKARRRMHANVSGYLSHCSIVVKRHHDQGNL